MWNESELELLKRNIWPSGAVNTLTPEQLQFVIEKKLFKIWIPEALGGLGSDLLSGLKILEQLAYEDGSLAWTVTLCSGANMFVGYIEPCQHHLFTQEDICLGGSGRASGVAEKRSGGYVVAGHWKYATGAPHLTHFTLNAEIWEDGKPTYDEKQQIKISSFFVNKEDVKIIYDWNTFGLESTASHSFTVKDVYIDKARAFVISPESITINEPIYTLCFRFFAKVTLLVNYLGMFKKFLKLVDASFRFHQQQDAWKEILADGCNAKLEEVKNEFGDQRRALYKMIEDIWQTHLTTGSEQSDRMEKVDRKSREAVRYIKENTALLFPYCGIFAARKDSEINVVFRNIFTATQHYILLDSL